MRPGDAVIVEHPGYALDGCYAVVIDDMSDGEAYVAALTKSNGEAHIVRAGVPVRPWRKGDPFTVK